MIEHLHFTHQDLSLIYQVVLYIIAPIYEYCIEPIFLLWLIIKTGLSVSDPVPRFSSKGIGKAKRRKSSTSESKLSNAGSSEGEIFNSNSADTFYIDNIELYNEEDFLPKTDDTSQPPSPAFASTANNSNSETKIEKNLNDPVHK